MFRTSCLLWANLLIISLCSCATAQNVGGAGESKDSLSDLYDRLCPSVGVIYTVQRSPSVEQRGQLTKHASLGSGVLISEDGKMMTAAHVVQTADNVFVQFQDGKKVVAKVLVSEPFADLALLQLSSVPASAVPAKLGDSDASSVGDRVFVIGAPYGIGYVLTAGYLSARHSPKSVIKDFELGEFFQTDAAVNKGNSGGPLFNLKGEVIGIVSSNLSLSGGFEGIGFAVTSKTARKLLIDEPGGWSGIGGYMLSGDMAKLLNLPQAEGLLVERVAAGSMASKAELRAGMTRAKIGEESLILGGDIVLAVMGIEVATRPEVRSEIKRSIKSLPVGSDIPLTVLRDGKKIEVIAKKDK
jgi:S1-C subfamily serine protease